MENDIPVHVRDYKLETRFLETREVVHIHDDPDAPPSSQRRLEYWKTEKSISRGGQGRVFLQKCTKGGRLYTHRAVKKIHLQEGNGRRRYIRELDIITRFSHDRYSKYFAKSLGWYESKSSLCIAMEYFPRGDLQAYLGEHSPLHEGDSRQVISQVLQGLAIMHREGFAHRDIKPRNVLIQQCPASGGPHTWWVKLADFGISKRLGAASGASTVIGTHEYMAPELLRQRPQDILPDVNYPAADMWALGVMVLRLLAPPSVFWGPWDVLPYLGGPDAVFPLEKLDYCHVSTDGKAFVRALMRLQPDERLDANAGILHAWVRSLMPSVPAMMPAACGEYSPPSSAPSSRRSSCDEERGMTTQVSNITDFPNASPKSLSTQPTMRPIKRPALEKIDRPATTAGRRDVYSGKIATTIQGMSDGVPPYFPESPSRAGTLSPGSKKVRFGTAYDRPKPGSKSRPHERERESERERRRAPEESESERERRRPPEESESERMRRRQGMSKSGRTQYPRSLPMRASVKDNEDRYGFWDAIKRLLG